MNRWIPIPSIPNFRELGGLKNNQGKVIKKGYVFRSGRIQVEDKNEFQMLENLHIGCVIDLRGNQEIEDRPDTKISGSEYKKIPGIPGASGAQQNLNFMHLINDETTEEEILGYHSLLVDCYPKMPFQNKAIQAMFDHLLHNQTPILYHCSAGKDRTGILSAILLLALDVNEKDIMEDYLLSNACRKETLVDFMERHKLTNKEIGQVAFDTIYVKEEYLQSAFQAIKNTYSSFEEYLKVEYGMNNNKLQQLRNFLLK